MTVTMHKKRHADRSAYHADCHWLVFVKSVKKTMCGLCERERIWHVMIHGFIITYILYQYHHMDSYGVCFLFYIYIYLLYIYIYMIIYLYIWLYLICVYMYIYNYLYIFIFVCIYIYMYVCIYICVYVYIYIYIYICIYIYRILWYMYHQYLHLCTKNKLQITRCQRTREVSLRCSGSPAGDVVTMGIQ